MPFDGITVRRWLRARRELVFEAWTRPELMTRWFFPGEAWKARVESDLRVGGRYTIDMRDHDGGTALLLTHELPADPGVRNGHSQGWEGCLGNLERWLNEGSAMKELKDEVRIKGTANAVYQALARQEGYRGWWNQAGEVDEVAGGEAKLHFVKDGKPVKMRFRIDEMKQNERVRWTCVAHDLESWVGTTLSWRLEEAAGAVLVSFEHGGWKDSAPDPVVQGWKHFLGSLKSYLETGTGQPW